MESTAVEKWIIDNIDIIKEVVLLEDVRANSDPEEDPYKSMYASRTLLHFLLASLEGIAEDVTFLEEKSNSAVLLHFHACKFALRQQLARNFNTTEEKSEGVRQLESALEDIVLLPIVNKFSEIVHTKQWSALCSTFTTDEDKRALLYVIGLLQQCLNSLGFVYGVAWGESEDNAAKGVSHLKNARRLYKAFCLLFLSASSPPLEDGAVQQVMSLRPLEMISDVKGEFPGPDYFYSLFNLTEEPRFKPENSPQAEGESSAAGEDANVVDWTARKRRFIEDNFTRTLFYLAQSFVKSSHPEGKSKSAKYCYYTLHRQLNSMEYEPVEWALNAATLSQFYHSNGHFLYAKHCLCAAEKILSEAYSDPFVDPSNPRPIGVDAQGNTSCREEQCRQAWADVHRCWLHLGLNLLSKSCDYAEEEQKPQEHHQHSRRPFQRFNLDLNRLESIRLPNLTEKAREERPNNYWVLVTFEEARQVFLFVQNQIKAAQCHYTLDSYCSDAICLLQDYSKAYKHLIPFEVSWERRSAMHKRQVDLLKSLLKELNPQHWLLVCRQLLFELGEVLQDMVTLKLAQIASRPSAQYRSKANAVAEESIEVFKRFIETYKSPDGDLPEQFPGDDERPVLLAVFYQARLYTKIVDDNSNPLQRHVKSLDCYKWICDYCDKHPAAKGKVQKEYEIAREMCSLLPAKMAKMADSIS